MVPKSNITGLILAGGAGRRVGHRDKGLIPWQGKPLIAHVRDCLKPQVGELLISCNRNFASYEEYADRTVIDRRPGYQGPLAGLETALTCLQTDFLVVVSCDTPHLPSEFVRRLVSSLSPGDKSGPEISYAHDGVRAQYLCAAMKRDCLSSLTGYLDNGHRAVQGWYRTRAIIAVDFTDQQSSFKNYNWLA